MAILEKLTININDRLNCGRLRRRKLNKIKPIFNFYYKKPYGPYLPMILEQTPVFTTFYLQSTQRLTYLQ
jgi:hypothetical protein